MQNELQNLPSPWSTTHQFDTYVVMDLIRVVLLLLGHSLLLLSELNHNLDYESCYKEQAEKLILPLNHHAATFMQYNSVIDTCEIPSVVRRPAQLMLKSTRYGRAGRIHIYVKVWNSNLPLAAKLRWAQVKRKGMSGHSSSVSTRNTKRADQRYNIYFKDLSSVKHVKTTARSPESLQSRTSLSAGLE